MDRRKELQMQYKNMKPDMGVYMIRPKTEKRAFIEASANLKGKINRLTFTLGMNLHPNQALQQDWSTYGEDGIEIVILEKLEYDKDETKEDYSAELELLLEIWKERLEAEGYTWYT
ncbi:GIY-YIG nuclease family protein [Marinicrinis sediminis]|uniref:GIY-YIG nuclease family protein n=1 Tax=Marinicrinis sediminis TaxID=1652465 RepID=A0ABW5R787_9BACL